MDQSRPIHFLSFVWGLLVREICMNNLLEVPRPDLVSGAQPAQAQVCCYSFYYAIEKKGGKGGGGRGGENE